MRSAQRKRRFENQARKIRYFRIIWWYAIPVFFVFLFVLIRLSTHHWNGKEKLAFTFPKKDGDVAVVVMDASSNEMTTLVVPGETEINMAMNYGALRIGNVWQFAKNEKLDGSLLAKTVTKNFSFPIFLWSDADGENFEKINIPGIIKFVLFPKKTNIPFGDRVSMAVFAFGIKNQNRSEIDLAKSQFLTKTMLSDGRLGYRLVGSVSARLTVFFSDTNSVGENIRVFIADSSGSSGLSQEVGKVIEVMGGKVISIDKSSGSSDLTCVVLGKNKMFVQKIVNIFGCKKTSGSTDFDLEIRLGPKFLGIF